MEQHLAMARVACRQRAWQQAHDLLQTVDDGAGLGAADLESFGLTAHLLGLEGERGRLWTRAHQAYLDDGDVAAAARCGFWLGLGLILSGDHAQGGGWLGRSGRLLEETGLDCPEVGLLMVAAAYGRIGAGDLDAAVELTGRASEIGARLGNADVRNMALMTKGSALVQRGDVEDGLVLLDEVMISITTDDLFPMAVGVIYCAVIAACYDAFDVARAHEWTAVMDAWCATQPDLVPYRGQCLVHRSQVMQLQGRWADALEEATRASARLGDPPHPAMGQARYQLAELHRVRGELRMAAEQYTAAAGHGRLPYPGLALLRLAEGSLPAAESGISGALADTSTAGERAKLLPAAVEIALAGGDVALARRRADEVADIARQMDGALLLALADHASGAVLLAEGDAVRARSRLREAAVRWRTLEAPYEGARTGVLMAQACEQLGDVDGAVLARDAARRVLTELGAATDLSSLVDGGPADVPPGGLTSREVQVLRLVATGMTNRAIADELFISGKTVARHLNNIFIKIDVSSRSAATAYAYEHGLV